MGAAAFFLIHPDDDEPFAHDWTDWIPTGDSIASRLWTVDSPAGSPAPTLTNSTTATVQVAGCVAGFTYQLTEKVTSTNGAVASRSITLRCENQ